MRGTQFAQLSALVAVAGQRASGKRPRQFRHEHLRRHGQRALRRLDPLDRLGQSDDTASAVAFLAGPDAGWIDGQTLRANGGII
jgi:NAD(P)-dependent dehydrogenase (short-subunit alcohol dehydrogenase family)